MKESGDSLKDPEGCGRSDKRIHDDRCHNAFRDSFLTFDVCVQDTVNDGQ
jgi:hypothetical protein